MSKQFIKNRHGKKLAVNVDHPARQKGLAFVMHGLGGFKEQPHIAAMAEAFLEHGYTVVRFDCANTFGESEGKYEEATITNYYADLEDVIDWVKTQTWYQEPFILAGHSLGGLCVALYAEKNPQKVKALAPISTVVSGKLSFESKTDSGELQKWQATGWRETKSFSRPGVIKRLPWSHMEDRLRYDMLPEAEKLTMPVLMIVGDQDEATPPGHQQILFDALPGRKELHIITGADHNFRKPEDLHLLHGYFAGWLNSIDEGKIFDEFCVSTKALVFDAEGKMLVLRRSATHPQRPFAWDLPGGVLAHEEQADAAMRREIIEETGLEVSDLAPYASFAYLGFDRQHWFTIAYRARASAGEIRLSYEHDRFAWLAPEEFLKLAASDKLKRIVRRYLDQ